MSNDNGNKAKKNGIKLIYDDYRTKSDEELVQEIQEGVNDARDVLSVRYFNMRNAVWDAVLPEAFVLIDPWDMNECYFMAYLAAESGYEGDMDTKFLTYFCSILKNCALNFIREHYRDKQFREAVSLDSLVGDEEDGEDRLTYGDYVGGNENEPVELVNYNELLEELGNTPVSDIDDWRDAILLSLKGYGTTATIKITGKEPHTLRRRVKLAKDHIKEWLEEQEEAAKPTEEENDSSSSLDDIDSEDK